MRFEILLDRVPNQRQAVENALGLTHHAVLALSRGSFGAREVWFTHEPLLSAHAYHRYFDGPVQFGKPFNRSEEHTSELQSLMRISYAVFCLKKKKKEHSHIHNYEA